MKMCREATRPQTGRTVTYAMSHKIAERTLIMTEVCSMELVFFLIAVAAQCLVYWVACKILDRIFYKEYEMPFPWDGRLFLILFILIFDYVMACFAKYLS